MSGTNLDFFLELDLVPDTKFSGGGRFFGFSTALKCEIVQNLMFFFRDLVPPLNSKNSIYPAFSTGTKLKFAYLNN